MSSPTGISTRVADPSRGPGEESAAVNEIWYLVSEAGRSALRIAPGLKIGETPDGEFTFGSESVKDQWLEFCLDETGRAAVQAVEGSAYALSAQDGQPLQRQPLCPGLTLAFPNNSLLVGQDILAPAENGPVVRVVPRHPPADDTAEEGPDTTLDAPTLDIAEPLPEPREARSAEPVPVAEDARLTEPFAGDDDGRALEGALAARAITAAESEVETREPGLAESDLTPVPAAQEEAPAEPLRPAALGDAPIPRQRASNDRSRRSAALSAIPFVLVLLACLGFVAVLERSAAPQAPKPQQPTAQQATPQRPEAEAVGPVGRTPERLGGEVGAQSDGGRETSTGADGDGIRDAMPSVPVQGMAAEVTPEPAEPFGESTLAEDELPETPLVSDLEPQAPAQGGVSDAAYEDPRIAQARTLIEAGRITYPPGANAVELLVAVMRDRPGHAQALSLLGDCTDILIRQATDAYARGLEYEARNILEELLGFNPDNERANRLWEAWMDAER